MYKLPDNIDNNNFTMTNLTFNVDDMASAFCKHPKPEVYKVSPGDVKSWHFSLISSRASVILSRGKVARCKLDLVPPSPGWMYAIFINEPPV